MQILTDHRVVITGGAGLLGRSFAEAVASSGGTAIVADLDRDGAKAVAEGLRDQGVPGSVDWIQLDITSTRAVSDCIETLCERHGRLSAVVNSAYPRNAHYGRQFFDVEYADLCDSLNSHLGGYFLVAQKFAEYFKGQGAGSIINIASIYGCIAPRFEIYQDTEMTMPVEYALIKSAIIQLTQYLAVYLKDTGVRVNSISPGGIRDAQPSKFMDAYRQQCLNIGMLSPEDISETLVFLLTEGSRAINGQNLIVDDGFSL